MNNNGTLNCMEKTNIVNINNNVNSKQNNIRRVGGIVFDKNSSLLIVYGNKSQKWGLPKGHIEKSESLYNGALREIYEETGLDLSLFDENKVKYMNVSKARLYIFYIEDVQPALSPQDTKEICSAIWLERDKCASISANANINKMLQEVINKINRKHPRLCKQ